MSKTATTLLTKAETLANGLKRNINSVQHLGIDQHFITRLEEEMATLVATDRAVEEQAAILAELREKNNAALARLNCDVQTAKKNIKKEFDKMEWYNLGITDKQ